MRAKYTRTQHGIAYYELLVYAALSRKLLVYGALSRKLLVYAALSRKLLVYAALSRKLLVYAALSRKLLVHAALSCSCTCCIAYCTGSITCTVLLYWPSLVQHCRTLLALLLACPT
jgi:hypothetical protein